VPHLNVFLVAHPSYGEKATQTVNLHATGDCKDSQDELQTHQPVSCDVAPQERYKPTCQKTGFESPGVVEFVVDDKEGIRLSDAPGGNRGGLEGRNNRSLFEGDHPDKPQITCEEFGLSVPLTPPTNPPCKLV
jgi:hypothetical protein